MSMLWQISKRMVRYFLRKRKVSLNIRLRKRSSDMNALIFQDRRLKSPPVILFHSKALDHQFMIVHSDKGLSVFSVDPFIQDLIFLDLSVFQQDSRHLEIIRLLFPPDQEYMISLLTDMSRTDGSAPCLRRGTSALTPESLPRLLCIPYNALFYGLALWRLQVPADRFP